MNKDVHSAKEVFVSNRNQVFVGLIIVLLGVLFLLGMLFEFNVWAVFWPLLLILLGLWLILRPRMVTAGTAVTQRFIGDVKRSGNWTVVDEDITLFIGGVKLDLTEAMVPLGETRLTVSGFVGDVSLVVPEDTGVAVHSSAFISNVRMGETKEESILTPVNLKSVDYKLRERQIRLQVNAFVSDVKVR